MRDEDRSAVFTPGGFSKECVARFTRRSFDRHLLLPPKCADVCRTGFKFNTAGRCRVSGSLDRPRTWQAEPLFVVTFNQPVHKPRVGIARSSAQSMIQVANDKSFVTQADQPV